MPLTVRDLSTRDLLALLTETQEKARFDPNYYALIAISSGAPLAAIGIYWMNNPVTSHTNGGMLSIVIVMVVVLILAAVMAKHHQKEKHINKDLELLGQALADRIDGPEPIDYRPIDQDNFNIWARGDFTLKELLQDDVDTLYEISSEDGKVAYIHPDDFHEFLEEHDVIDRIAIAYLTYD